MQRPDDTAEALVNRLKSYHAETVPVLEHYRLEGIVTLANANQGMPEVWSEIAAGLGMAEKPTAAAPAPAPVTKSVGGANVMKVLGPSVFLQVTGGCMLLQSRPQLAMQVMGGSATTAGVLLGQLVSGAALLEFFINPVFGRMSDTYGRSVFLKLGCLGPTITRLLVFLRPSLATIALDRVLGPAVTTAWFSVVRASQTDKMSGPELAKAQGPIAVAAGLGVIIGPILDGIFTSIGGSKLPFLVAAIMAAAPAVAFTTMYEETLEEKDKRPFGMAGLLDCSPFGFVKMLKMSRAVKWLMVTSGMQAFSEGRTITEINTIFCTKDLEWSTAKLTTFISSYGVCVLLGGIFGGRQIAMLGQSTHTTVSNLSNFASFMIWGAAKKSTSWLLFVAMVVSLLGQRKRDCVESMVTEICVDGGMGKGEVSASMANFRTLPGIVGPITMGYVYAWATSNPSKRYIPGLPFYIVGVLMLLAEGSFRMLSKKEMGLDENGKYVGFGGKNMKKATAGIKAQ